MCVRKSTYLMNSRFTKHHEHEVFAVQFWSADRMFDTLSHFTAYWQAKLALLKMVLCLFQMHFVFFCHEGTRTCTHVEVLSLKPRRFCSQPFHNLICSYFLSRHNIFSTAHSKENCCVFYHEDSVLWVTQLSFPSPNKEKFSNITVYFDKELRLL